MPLPVPGRGSRSFGHEANVNGPKSGPKLHGHSAQVIWDRILIRSHELRGPNRPKTGTPKPGPGTGSNIKTPKPVFKNSRLAPSEVFVPGFQESWASGIAGCQVYRGPGVPEFRVR